MATLNRLAVVVKPKQAFLDWLHAADPASHELTLWESATGTNDLLDRRVRHRS